MAAAGSSGLGKDKGNKRTLRPTSNKKKKNGKAKVGKSRVRWVAPVVFTSLSSVAIVISGLHGLWNEWYVKWALVPAALLASTIGAYEFCWIQLKRSRISSVIIAVTALGLLAFGTIWVYKSIPIEPSWEPPELPKDCNTILLAIGPGVFEISTDSLKNGKPFAPDVRSLTNEQARNIIKTMPTVILRNNRIYLQGSVWGMPGTKVFSDPSLFDATLPIGWDRNHNANAFEIVNEFLLPSFQVIYQRPNVIRVNGTFLLTGESNGVRQAWGALALYGTNHHAFGFLTNRDDEIRLMKPFKDQVLFKYPSWEHPGELAN